MKLKEWLAYLAQRKVVQKRVDAVIEKHHARKLQEAPECYPDCDIPGCPYTH